MAQNQSVLIVGAGPTGLAHALWLTRQGVPVRIIDKNSGPGETSRAIAVQARTLELYRQLDLADAVVAAGYPNPAMNLWTDGKHQARLPMDDAGATVTPYPFILVCPQDQHECLLIGKLKTLGIQVERYTELISFKEHTNHVLTCLRLPDGSQEMCRFDFLSACDGAHSLVRHRIGASFEGGTYKQMFYVADVRLSGLEPRNEAHLALDSADFVAVLSYGHGMSRLIGVVTAGIDGSIDPVTFDDVAHRAIERLNVRIESVQRFSTYRVHHRVTHTFRRGRIFLLGDAAHVHSPSGGQGMNTGIGDAINLAWKLAAVIQGQAPDALLDTYSQERQAFARTLVETTDRIFTFMTKEGRVANFVRTRIAPLVAGLAYQVDGVREMMFRLVSQTKLSYYESALSAGAAGSVEGGDRLPWAPTNGKDNFGSLSQIAWQIHVYGSVVPDLLAWAERRNIQLNAFAWNEGYALAGLARDAAYLLRPDTYVALAVLRPSVEVFKQYLQARGITPSA